MSFEAHWGDRDDRVPMSERRVANPLVIGVGRDSVEKNALAMRRPRRPLKNDRILLLVA